MRLFLLLILVIIPLSASPTKEGKKSIRILFVGNSLTYYNNLPGLLNEIGVRDKVSVQYKLIGKPDYSLEDHWNNGVVQKEIASKKYDFVIGQQGPSALPESQIYLQTWAEKYAEACKRAGVKWGLYMVWPSKARSFDFDNVIYSYSQAARVSTGILFPAGQAWKHAWKENSELPLYGPDQFHPSVMGSVLAAMTIYAVLLSKQDLDFLPYEKMSWNDQVDHNQFELLKRAAISASRIN